ASCEEGERGKRLDKKGFRPVPAGVKTHRHHPRSGVHLGCEDDGISYSHGQGQWAAADWTVPVPEVAGALKGNPLVAPGVVARDMRWGPYSRGHLAEAEADNPEHLAGAEAGNPEHPAAAVSLMAG